MPKKKILFQLNYLYHLPAVEPIVQLFAEDLNYDVVYQIGLDFQYKFGVFRRKVDQLKFRKYFPNNVREVVSNEEFEIVIGTDIIDRTKYKSTHYCIVYHGPTFNKTVTYRELKKHSSEKNTIFTESDFTKEKLLESDSVGNSIVEVVGFPKMDPFINYEFDRSKILNELGLDEDKKTVLYAPTYKPTSIYDLSDEIFEATINYNLIIKLHHYSWMGKYASRSQSRLFTKKLKEYKHAALLPREDFNIVPLYAVADTLISEASGALTEFLLTNKIGIIYNLDWKQLSRSNDEPLLSQNNDLLKDVFVQISSPSELSLAIDKALNPDEESISLAKKYRDKYFSMNDGKASKRIKAYIDNMLL